MFDIRLALRVMRRQPGFTLVSVTLIALAIAATTSIFSVVNSVVLEPLPSVKMDGLVVISNEVVHSGPPWKEWALPHVPFRPRGAPSETSS